MRTRSRYSRYNTVSANSKVSRLDNAVSVMKGLDGSRKTRNSPKSIKVRGYGPRGDKSGIGELQNAAHKLFLSMRKESNSSVFDKVIDSAQELTMDYIYVVLRYLDDGIRRADGEQVRDASETIKKLYRVMPSY